MAASGDLVRLSLTPREPPRPVDARGGLSGARPRLHVRALRGRRPAGAIAGMRALGHPRIRRLAAVQAGGHAPARRARPVAARIGAVNTIVNTAGRLVGHNTDWIGAVRALEEARPLEGARTLLVGAGGAARAIAFGLRERGAEFTIANRDAARAAALAVETGGRGARARRGRRAPATTTSSSTRPCWARPTRHRRVPIPEERAARRARSSWTSSTSPCAHASSRRREGGARRDPRRPDAPSPGRRPVRALHRAPRPARRHGRRAHPHDGLVERKEQKDQEDQKMRGLRTPGLNCS